MNNPCSENELPPIKPTSGPQPPSKYDCDFEVDQCGWTNDVSDVLDWTYWSGSTPSSNTGPETDHTTLNSQVRCTHLKIYFLIILFT